MVEKYLPSLTPPSLRPKRLAFDDIAFECQTCGESLCWAAMHAMMAGVVPLSRECSIRELMREAGMLVVVFVNMDLSHRAVYGGLLAYNSMYAFALIAALLTRRVLACFSRRATVPANPVSALPRIQRLLSTRPSLFTVPTANTTGEPAGDRHLLTHSTIASVRKPALQLRVSSRQACYHSYTVPLCDKPGEGWRASCTGVAAEGAQTSTRGVDWAGVSTLAVGCHQLLQASYATDGATRHAAQNGGPQGLMVRVGRLDCFLSAAPPLLVLIFTLYDQVPHPHPLRFPLRGAGRWLRQPVQRLNSNCARLTTLPGCGRARGRRWCNRGTCGW